MYFFRDFAEMESLLPYAGALCVCVCATGTIRFCFDLFYFIYLFIIFVKKSINSDVLSPWTMPTSPRLNLLRIKREYWPKFQQMHRGLVKKKKSFFGAVPRQQ